MRFSKKPDSFIQKAFWVADTLLFSVFLFLLILPYLKSSHEIRIAIPVYFLILIPVLMIRKRYSSAIRKNRLLQKEKQRQIERILLIGDDTLSDLLGKDRFILIRKERPDRFDVMEAIRMQPDAIGLFSEDETLKKLIRTYLPETTVYLVPDLLDALFETGRKRDASKETVLKRFILYKYNRYLILGILFLAASFFLRFKIYYRIISSVCLIIASVTGILDHRKSNKNFLIFLDKMDD